MTSIVEVFEQVICRDWLIERHNSDWYVREHNITSNPVLKLFGAKAFGFSLEGRIVWPFMNQLQGLHKVCDAIIVAEVDNTAFVVAVEMKSNNIGSATTQISNSWLFMEWLGGLLESHMKFRRDWLFCGLISYTPRRQERKGTSRRRPDISISNSGPYPVAFIKNRVRLNILDLRNAL